MMKKFSNIIIIALLLILIVFQYLNSNNATVRIETKIKSDSIFVTMPTKIERFETTKVRTVYIPVTDSDSVFIEKYYYDTVNNVSRETFTEGIETKDTINNVDGEFRVTTVSTAPILFSKLDYDLTRLEITKTITNTVNPKHLFFIGGGIATNREKVGLFGSLQYQNKNSKVFQYSYDPFNRVHDVKVLFKIGR